MNIMRKLSHPFVVFVEKFYPNPFVFIVILTIISFLFVVGFTDTSMTRAIGFWGDGLPLLLAFMAQISITLIAAHALAHTSPVKRLLAKVSSLPRSQFQAYFIVTFISALANLFAWSLGLIVGAILAKSVAREGANKGLKLHYPLLVASAYAGFVVWHMGYSSSAALFVATEGHSMVDLTGIIPVTETIFAPFNIAIAAVVVIAISIVCPLMHPNEGDLFVLDIKEADERKEEEDIESQNNLGDKLDHWRWVPFILGLMLLSYICLWFFEKGFDLNLNIVNWTFLTFTLLLVSNVKDLVRLVKNASKTVGPILLQFPFYAGILGLLKGSGLISTLSGGFASIATAKTLPILAFLSGGVVNMFVPSGGGQWAIQGPIFMQAAQELNVSPGLMVMSIAYGDQWTNMIQPFFTIPLLAIAGLSIRKIMGYTFVILLVTAFIFMLGLYIAS